MYRNHYGGGGCCCGWVRDPMTEQEPTELLEETYRMVKEMHESVEIETPFQSATNTTQNASPIRPWDEINLNRSEYYALKAISVLDGHPRSKEVNKKYLELSDKEPSGDSSTPKVAPRLTELYNTGYVERPPNQPYVYWLTEKGEEVLDD